MNILDILICLFDIYGDILPQEMATLRERIEKMDFDPKEPVDEIFTEIDSYAEIASIVDDPMTSTQECKIAYIALLNTKKFRSGLKEWDKKDRQHQTWENFKTHFRNVQQQLRRTGDLTIEETLNNEELILMV